MNVHRNAKRLLVYGDSFTYGKVSGDNRRLDVDERFTGLMQSQLGTDYEVIEEGLRGRNLVGENPHFNDRDGLKTFGPIVGSHLHLDLLIIALGTNDCNSREGFDAMKIASSLESYSEILTEWCIFLGVSRPEILVVLPPDIIPEYFDEMGHKIFGELAADKVVMLRDSLSKLCQRNGLRHLDASKVCRSAAGDGVHLDVENNHHLANAIVTEVKHVIG